MHSMVVGKQEQMGTLPLSGAPTVLHHCLCLCRDGRRSGRDEGRGLGLQKGFEIGHEVGFYAGCCQLWRQLQAREPALFRCERRHAAGLGDYRSDRHTAHKRALQLGSWDCHGPPLLTTPLHCRPHAVKPWRAQRRSGMTQQLAPRSHPHGPAMPAPPLSCSQRVDKGIAAMEEAVCSFPLDDPKVSCGAPAGMMLGLLGVALAAPAHRQWRVGEV